MPSTAGNAQLRTSVATTIRYVKAGGISDGSSWGNASGDLQAMINASAPGDQVWIAAGTYKPTSIANLRDASFSLKEGVNVLGGFTGTSGTEGDASTRTATPSSTTLSGDLGQPGEASDNAYHVVNNTNNGLTNATTLDGVVITGGNASGDYTNPSGQGGGMYNLGSSPTILNCLFTQNTGTTGGGLYEQQASSRIINCSFIANDGKGPGGGASVLSGRTSFSNCFFSRNNGVEGGAVDIRGLSNVTLTNCTFVSNNAIFGASLSNIAPEDQNSIATLINCLLWNNQGQNSIYTRRDSRVISTTTARYCVFEAGTIGYIDEGYNQIITNSPFVTATDPQLTACSPAVDAGDPTTTSAMVGTVDLAGNSRFVRNRVDIGAYEYQGAACPQQLNYVYTVQAGRWDNPAIWSAGRLPASMDKVLLKHAITIPRNYLANVLKLEFDVSGKLIYETGGRLLID
ncbi:hypothetical protein GCM10027341_10980 [Spirosoma knui]